MKSITLTQDELVSIAATAIKIAMEELYITVLTKGVTVIPAVTNTEFHDILAETIWNMAIDYINEKEE